MIRVGDAIPIFHQQLLADRRGLSGETRPQHRDRNLEIVTLVGNKNLRQFGASRSLDGVDFALERRERIFLS